MGNESGGARDEARTRLGWRAQRRRRCDLSAGNESCGARDVARTREDGERRGGVGAICARGTKATARDRARAASTEAASARSARGERKWRRARCCEDAARIASAEAASARSARGGQKSRRT